VSFIKISVNPSLRIVTAGQADRYTADPPAGALRFLRQFSDVSRQMPMAFHAENGRLMLEHQVGGVSAFPKLAGCLERSGVVKVAAYNVSERELTYSVYAAVCKSPWELPFLLGGRGAEVEIIGPAASEIGENLFNENNFGLLFDTPRFANGWSDTKLKSSITRMSGFLGLGAGAGLAGIFGQDPYIVGGGALAGLMLSTKFAPAYAFRGLSFLRERLSDSKGGRSADTLASLLSYSGGGQTPWDAAHELSAILQRNPEIVRHYAGTLGSVERDNLYFRVYAMAVREPIQKEYADLTAFMAAERFIRPAWQEDTPVYIPARAAYLELEGLERRNLRLLDLSDYLNVFGRIAELPLERREVIIRAVAERGERGCEFADGLRRASVEHFCMPDIDLSE